MTGEPPAPPEADLRFAAVADTVAAVTAAPGRSAKVAALAECLRATPDDLVPAVLAWLSGTTRQRRTGLGWAAVRDLLPAAEARPDADRPVLAREVDAALSAAEATQGGAAARATHLREVLARASGAERDLLVSVLTGGARSGAGAGVVLDAVVVATEAPAGPVRRAAMLLGDPAAALLRARHGGVEALAAVGLQVGVPVSPMLAASAPSVEAALEVTGAAGVEWKLDGIRVQVHRAGEEVRFFTRTLDDISPRLPDLAQAVRALDADPVVLDGEVLALSDDGSPLPFQVSSARAARHARDPQAEPLTLVVFDLLHLAGRDLFDADGPTRRRELERVVPGGGGPVQLVPRLDVDPSGPDWRDAARAFTAGASTAGHEGVVVKSHAAAYAMGRRGVGWVKVKPRLTLDLLVVAAEWGHGRRTGLLSNLHLAARDPAGRFGPPGGTVMLGKTFKGLTDATLRWQTEQLLERAVARTTWQVDVRPELVAEIALDGLQVSRRYPAGVALRFARVLRYREDKTADEADTVETVLSLTAGAVSDDGAVPDDGADGTPDDVPGDARVEASTAAIGTTDPGRTDDL